MTDCPPDQPPKRWYPIIGAVVLVAMAAAFALGGYKVGVENARVLEVQVPIEVPVPGPVQYVDVPGPERIVKEPYEVRVEVPVPGPEVYIPVPGPVVVKKIVVLRPRYCPKPQSVADELNEYEALLRK